MGEREGLRELTSDRLRSAKQLCESYTVMGKLCGKLFEFLSYCVDGMKK